MPLAIIARISAPHQCLTPRGVWPQTSFAHITFAIGKKGTWRVRDLEGELVAALVINILQLDQYDKSFIDVTMSMGLFTPDIVLSDRQLTHLRSFMQ